MEPSGKHWQPNLNALAKALLFLSLVSGPDLVSLPSASNLASRKMDALDSQSLLPTWPLVVLLPGVFTIGRLDTCLHDTHVVTLLEYCNWGWGRHPSQESGTKLDRALLTQAHAILPLQPRHPVGFVVMSAHVITTALCLSWEKLMIKWAILIISLSSTSPPPILFYHHGELNFLLLLIILLVVAKGNKGICCSALRLPGKLNGSQAGWSFLGKV